MSTANLNQQQGLLHFISELIRYRIHTEILGRDYAMPALELPEDDSPIHDFVVENDLTQSDLIALILSLIPHLHPAFLDGLISELLPEGQKLPEFGGAKAKNHPGLIPTGETLLFILCGNNLKTRISTMEYFQSASPLFVKHILSLEEVPAGEPEMSGRLIMDQESIDRFTTGYIQKPKMSANFPAKLIETELEWENLILQSKTINQIQEIQTWLQYNDQVMNEWGMRAKVKPGFRVMFYGPPGTGKTLTASLLGKYTARDVYRIDLSLVVSKYIGETEKNLSKLFDKAADKDWILFFDEADSVFGKRTNVKDAHDKYANQEVSYLLQRIEAHPGLVILASNLKGNIDAAFTRRFQSIIEFESPGVKERLLLWEDNLPVMVPLEDNVSLTHLSKSYTLTGANIVNVVQYACLRTAQEGKRTISLEHLMNGIRKEHVKEGRMM